jgi:hypothetical protein
MDRMSEPTQHSGGCHCKRVRYQVKIAADSGIACNCSMCAKKGTLLNFVGAGDFTLESGEDNLTDYQFNKNVIHHLFCKTCGVTSFARGKGPNGADMVAVNLRCLDDFEADAVKVKQHDGRAA